MYLKCCNFYGLFFLEDTSTLNPLETGPHRGMELGLRNCFLLNLLPPVVEGRVVEMSLVDSQHICLQVNDWTLYQCALAFVTQHG